MSGWTVVHLTMEADYAVRMMMSLASDEEKRFNAKKLSESSEVTLRFALKILRKLVGQGLVRSYQGTRGGYQLARPSKEITLRDIVETVEGPYTISRCLSPSCGCNREHRDPCCKVQEVFEGINIVVRQRMEEVTLDRLI